MGLISSANYLVQLYYKTGENYKLTRNKLQCLLIIAELCHMKCGSRKYEVPISFYYNELFGFKKISFDVLSSFYVSDIVIGKQNEDGIIKHQINNDVKTYPKRYETNNISKEECALLDEIFNQYGNCSVSILSRLIDSFLKEVIERHIKQNKFNGLVDYEMPSRAIIFDSVKFKYYEITSSKLVSDFVALCDEDADYSSDSLFGFISEQADTNVNDSGSYYKKRRLNKVSI